MRPASKPVSTHWCARIWKRSFADRSARNPRSPTSSVSAKASEARLGPDFPLRQGGQPCAFETFLDTNVLIYAAARSQGCS